MWVPSRPVPRACPLCCLLRKGEGAAVGVRHARSAPAEPTLKQVSTPVLLAGGAELAKVPGRPQTTGLLGPGGFSGTVKRGSQ